MLFRSTGAGAVDRVRRPCPARWRTTALRGVRALDGDWPGGVLEESSAVFRRLQAHPASAAYATTGTDCPALRIGHRATVFRHIRRVAPSDSLRTRFLVAAAIWLAATSDAFAQSTYYLWTGHAGVHTQVDVNHRSVWVTVRSPRPHAIGASGFQHLADFRCA